MDRRTKIILLSIGSVILLAVVFWFIIWPLLKPVLPNISAKPQPPEIGTPNAPIQPSQNTPTGTATSTPTFTYNPGEHPDAEKIAELSRRAGVFSEMSESGSNEKGFENLLFASQDASPKLADVIRAKRSTMQKQYPIQGPLYLTIARRLVEIPDDQDIIAGDIFGVRVQLQVQVKNGDQSSVEYREASVKFTNVDGNWLLSGYEVKLYNP